MVLNENNKAFVIYISSLKMKTTIYSAKKAQMASLFVEKVINLAKYPDFINIFLEKLANIFLKQTGANKYVIELKKVRNHPIGQFIA